MKKYASIILLLIIFCTAAAKGAISKNQTENLNDSTKSKLSFSLGMDLVTRYIWRGVEFGVSSTGSSSPHFQPNASLTYNVTDETSFSLGLWGSYGFDGYYSENDISLNYTYSSSAGIFSLTLNDYYFPYLGIPVSNFEGEGLGGHTIEAQFAYTLPEGFPLSIAASTNIHNDLTDDKSFYVEFGYPFAINDINFSLFAGIAQGKSIWHYITSENFEFCNVGFKASKSIKITQDYSLPVGIFWIYNYHQKKTFLVFKISV